MVWLPKYVEIVSWSCIRCCIESGSLIGPLRFLYSPGKHLSDGDMEGPCELVLFPTHYKPKYIGHVEGVHKNRSVTSDRRKYNECSGSQYRDHQQVVQGTSRWTDEQGPKVWIFQNDIGRCSIEILPDRLGEYTPFEHAISNHKPFCEWVWRWKSAVYVRLTLDGVFLFDRLKLVGPVETRSLDAIWG